LPGCLYEILYTAYTLGPLNQVKDHALERSRAGYDFKVLLKFEGHHLP
jgi:hypothetical protein